MAKGGTEMEVGPDGVAVIAVANPPVNALSIDVLYSLKDRYEEALRRNDVKAIVLTGRGGIFSAGLDISAFGDIQRNIAEQIKGDYMWVDVMTDILEDAGKPSVAAIDGLAFGGGLEFSMVCQARISTPYTKLGLPELQLGVIPAFGGTQRLPRLVGLKKAHEMMMDRESTKFALLSGICFDKETRTNLRFYLSWVRHKCRKPWLSRNSFSQAHVRDWFMCSFHNVHHQRFLGSQT